MGQEDGCSHPSLPGSHHRSQAVHGTWLGMAILGYHHKGGIGARRDTSVWERFRHKMIV